MRAERLVRWWVDRYTRGLPAETRAERAEELASDLWEHRATLGEGPGAGLALVSRCLRGVPADLSWRRARRGARHLPSRGSLARGLGWALAAAAYAFLVAMHGYVATPAVGLDAYDPDWDTDDVMALARVSGLLWALLVAGALALRRLPRTGAALVSAGALGTPVAFWWGAALWGPIAVGVTAAATVLARRRNRQLRASSATS